jgi:hypothetical protein
VTGGLIYGNVNDQKTAKGIDFAIGSSASSGGDGGDVTLTNTGSVTTHYNASHGVFAQSVGGGGGHAGSLGGIGTADGSLTWGATFAVGGSGSEGDGGEVSVVLSGGSNSVQTTGDGSHGVFAQSVGGGGGSAANAAGQGGADDPGPYTTKNAKIGITLGGTDGAGGTGGAITVAGDADLETAATGLIRTSGSHAVGILAQSIGGGGGTGGVGLAGATGTTLSLGSSGNSSGAIGNASIVNVYFGGQNYTKGDGAIGILAQSVGGGGGYGGVQSLSGDAAFGNDLSMGGDATANGTGGPALVTLTGAEVITEGADAAGIFAQSVGGGGGIKGRVEDGADMSGAMIGSAGGVGDSFNAFVSLEGGSSILTLGASAHGIVVQSAASQGTGRNAIVTLSGGSRVSTSGIGASGILAQSVGASGRTGQIEVTIDETSSVEVFNSASTTDGSNAAIWARDGNALNSITNAGTITSSNGAGVAVRYTGAAGITVTNTGTINGTFQKDLSEVAAIAGGDPLTEVINEEGGEIYTGGSSNFGRLTNSGFVGVDEGDGGLALAEFGGDFRNMKGGILALDLGLTETGLLASDAFFTGSGTVGFEFGSILSLSLLDSFRYQTGSTFNLLGGLDLWFEGEEEDDFALSDYVIGDFLDEDWEFSIDPFLGGSFSPLGPVGANGPLLASAYADFEVLSVTYVGDVAPIPLPASAFLYASLLLAGGGVGWFRRRHMRLTPIAGPSRNH